MLGALLGAIAGGVQAAAAKTGEAIDDFAQRSGMPPLLRAATSSLTGLVEAGAGALKDIELPDFKGSLAMVGDTVKTSLGFFGSSEPIAEAPAVKVGRSADNIYNVKDAQLTAQRGQFDVDVAVALSAPPTSTLPNLVAGLGRGGSQMSNFG